MIINNKTKELYSIGQGDVFKYNDRLYTVICDNFSSENTATSTTYILVSCYGNQICRHYNPMSNEDLLLKILSDNYEWEYIGHMKIKITFEELKENDNDSK